MSELEHVDMNIEQSAHVNFAGPTKEDDIAIRWQDIRDAEQMVLALVSKVAYLEEELAKLKVGGVAPSDDRVIERLRHDVNEFDMEATT
jgi:hypothetical protein